MKYTLDHVYDYKFRFIVVEIKHGDMTKEIASFKYEEDADDYISYLNTLKDSCISYFAVDMLATRNGKIDIKI